MQRKYYATVITRFLAAAVVALVAVAAPPVRAAEVTIPNFWDPREQLTRPDLSALPRLRFLTTTDFPPFNFVDRAKRLTGFNVDLARAVCAELRILARCQIQAMPFAEIEEALARGEGDAIIAGIAVTAETRTKYEFTRPYLRVPSRFAGRKDAGLGEPMVRTVARAVTGLVEGSSQRAWFTTAFAGARSEVFETRRDAFAALAEGKIDLLFLDAVSLSYWLQSEASASCCAFVGGPYFHADQQADGLTIAFARGQTALAAAADFALKELSERGVFADLYLRYFPLGLY